MSSTRSGRSQALLLLALLALAGPAQAVDQAALDGLKQLFETDPAAGFVKAQELFDEPKGNGDLDGMMAVIDATAGEAHRLGYALPVYAMLQAALTVAEARGSWREAADLHMAAYGLEPIRNRFPARALRRLDLAEKAYARAGELPRSFADTRDFMRPWHEGDMANYRAGKWWGFGGAQEMTAALVAAHEALGEGRGEAAVQMMADLVRGPAPDQWSAGTVLVAAADFSAIPEGEALLPLVREALSEHYARYPGDRETYWALVNLQGAYFGRWGGRDPAAWDGVWWAHNLMRAMPAVGAPMQSGIVSLLWRWGRRAEAGRMVDEVLAWSAEVGREPFDYASLLSPEASPEQRRRVAYLVCRKKWPDYVASQFARTTMELGGVLDAVTDGERVAWNAEVGTVLRDAALGWAEPADRVKGLGEAARIFGIGSRPDLADQCRELAKAIASSDPKTLLHCALSSAHSFAAEGKWEEVRTALGPAVANQPPSPELLQASVLLTEAHLRLGDAVGGDQWLAKSKELVETLRLPAGERANHLVALAGLCELAAQAAEGGAP